jgi:CIC family chloride channel protein
VVTPRFAYIVISSVVADFLAHAFLGDKRTFAVPQFGIVSTWEIGFYVLVGIAAAFAALALIRLLYRCEDLFDALKLPDYFKPALGGIAIGLIGLYSHDLFGVGYRGIEKALSGQLALGALLLLSLLKVLATSVTIGSGGSGGIFAPSLFIGAMLGTALGDIFHGLFPSITAPAGAYGIVGMAAVFAGAARAPFTAMLILFEMTGDYAIILPLMTAVVVSTLLARSLSRETIYTLKLRRRGIDIQREEPADVMRTITVGEVMTRSFPTVPATMRVEELYELLHSTGHHGFPVLDEEGRLVGIITLSDVERSLKKGSADLKVGDIATKSPFVAYPDQSLYEVLGATEEDYGRIPVVSRDDRRHLVGVLRRYDIIRAYRERVRRMAPRPGGY